MRYLLAMLLILCASLPAAAEPITVRGAIFDQYARITFQNAPYESLAIRSNGNSVTIHADRPLKIDPKAVAASMEDYISSATLSEDGKTLVLKLKSADIRWRKFAGEKSAGLDLLAAAKPAAKEKPKEQVKKRELPPTPAAKAEAALPPVKKETPQLSPPQKIAKPKEPEAKPASAAVAAPVSPVKETPPPSHEKAPAAAETKPASTEAKPGPYLASSGKPVFIFPWKEKVAAASFIRGHTLWLVFDRRITHPVPAHPLFASINQVPDRHYTILRFTLADAYNFPGVPGKTMLSPMLTKQSSAWILAFKENGPVYKPVPLDITSKNVRDRQTVFISALKTGEPLQLHDPEIGDALFVVPMYESGDGITPARRFPEFSIAETLQGIVIERSADTVQPHVMRDGVEISSTTGLVLGGEIAPEPPSPTDEPKPASPAAAAAATPAQVQKVSGLPFTWNGAVGKDFTTTRQILMQNLLAAGDLDKNAGRMKLAHYYFSQGFYPDSYGVLKDRANFDIQFANQEDVQFLTYANLMMLRRYPEARDGFKRFYARRPDGPLADEARFLAWASDRILPAYKREGVPLAVELSTPPGFLSSYPADLKSKFYLLAAEDRLERADTAASTAILARLDGESPDEAIKRSSQYLRGRIAEKEGKKDEAKKIWEGLVEEIDDRRTRALAELGLVQLKRANQSMSLEDAIKKLEHLRIVWRQPEIEIPLLSELGSYHIQNKHYLEGLRTWRELLTYYPDAKENSAITSRMSETFVALFKPQGNEPPAAYQMPPVTTLALYFEFRELTPLGKEGDIITRQLAEHFIRADLLDSAAIILAHQIKFRAEGEEKVKLAARLAEVQLNNKKPKEALEAIDMVSHAKPSPEMAAELARLKAQALKAMQQYDKALASLSSTGPKESGIEAKKEGADPLRIELLWQQKNWKEFIALVAPEVKSLEAGKQALSLKETEKVMRLAIAYSNTANKEAMNKLKDIFLARLSNPGDKQTLITLAGGMDSVDPRNLDESVGIQDVEALLKSSPGAPAESAPEAKPPVAETK